MGKERSVSDSSFCSFLNRRIGELMGLAAYVSRHAGGGECFTRPLLADLLSEATKIEELLDAHGAKHNQHWFPLRQVVASIKLFSNASYILLHVLHFLPAYRLLPIEQDFPGATKKALEFTCSILLKSVKALLRTARTLQIRTPDTVSPPDNFQDNILDGRLPFDRPSQKVASPEETVVHLATAFLNLAEDSKFLHAVQDQRVDSFADWIPDPISEERLRNLEQMFHNLQSLYDTHISDSNVESLDEDLPVLRGHITIIFHLLETATAFAHYCERHILSFRPQARKSNSTLVDPSGLLDVLISYSLAFASRYISRTRSLCHRMLKRYAIQGLVTVTAPRYRGFHVRPSTLVAKIVNHYGSEVIMKLDGETYNAGITLDLFRANEKLNAGKRRWLAEEIRKLGLRYRPEDAERGWNKETMQRLAHRSIQTLFSQNKVVLYGRNLPVDEISPLENETAADYITRALIQLLTMGKVDVVMDIAVTFNGDKRVLEDIKLLAENGYGEDDFGNNLPLPEKLGYLRK